ncbi:hypothetical protein [Vibrio rotiferianus]|uniref:hypothetical protein n=1 Tax=Vibrio rotiferianus TaxID=190895 RepID=UPI0039094CF9
MKFQQHIHQYFPNLELSSLEELTLYSSKEPVSDVTSFADLIYWPPNIFVILYTLIERTDKYRLLVSPKNGFGWKKVDQDEVDIINNDWHKLLADMYSQQNLPFASFDILHNLTIIFNKNTYNSCIYELFKDPQFSKACFKILLAIDKLFSKINVCNYNKLEPLQFFLFLRESFKTISQSKLNTTSNISDCHSKNGIVTFKSSVPQTGLTMNNVTHNLTVIKPTVKPHIVSNRAKSHGFNKSSYNILFLPWPQTVSSSSFKIAKNDPEMDMNGYFGFFDYKPKKSIDTKLFLAALKQGINRAGQIDLIVLPECAMSNQTFEEICNDLSHIFKEHAPSLLSGVYGEEPDGYGINSAKLAFVNELGTYQIEEQRKHHRWFLDQSQIRNYNLANALDPGRKWWEKIKIGRRRLLTVHSNKQVTLCPLICEDLARQEPVAQAVRSVGANLVVSLLLDGPQLSFRWSGKYAAVLSDDPGSSVLSVTALGMTQRATGLGHDPSSDVALWSEPGKSATTLNLKDDHDGLVLELTISPEQQWTIDGRLEEKSVLRKNEVTPIKISESDRNKTQRSLRDSLAKEFSRGR